MGSGITDLAESFFFCGVAEKFDYDDVLDSDDNEGDVVDRN